VAVRVGIAGFDYPDWNGVVYPPRVRGSQRLHYVAGYLDLLELNSSFYRIPAPAAVARWGTVLADRPHLRFSVKLWQGFTHGAAWPEAGDGAAFRAAVAPLVEAGRLSAVLAQFPWHFADGSAARARLKQVAELCAGLPLVVEVRHASFAEAPALAFLRGLGAALATLDMPLARESLRPHELVTGALGYVRLHGRNAGAWFDPKAGRDQKYDWLYSGAELAEWVPRIERLAAQCAEVLVVTNNHFRGQAFANALELLAAVQHTLVAVPEPLLVAFPRLLAIARPQAPPPAQAELFPLR